MTVDIYIENLELNGLITFERTLYSHDYLDQYEKLINEDYKEIKDKVQSSLSEFD